MTDLHPGPEHVRVSLAKPRTTDPGPLAPVVPLHPNTPTAKPTPPKPMSVGRRRVRITYAACVNACRDERTRRAARFTARHGLYLAGGVRVLARRAWSARTAAKYERAQEAAQAAGLHEQAMLWEERGRAYRQQRHQRRMDLLTAPAKVAHGAAVGTATGAGVLLALGGLLAWATGDWADVLTPTLALVEVVRVTALVIAIVWGPFLALAPWIVLASLWAVGRHAQAAPGWSLPPAQRKAAGDDGAPITPSIVVTALRDLGITQLRKAIKGMGDNGAQMLSPIVIAGCGVEVDVTLPSGVTTEEVQAKRRKLAENLNRHEHEVFPTLAPAARTLRLWIADSGALDEPIGPSPLTFDTDTTADYAKGRAPWGQNLRGETTLISLYQRHLLITGLSNQGKTASLRALALWLCLDPTVEFWIGDLKGVGDWSMFDGLATRLVEGPTDDHVADITEMVEDAVGEMDRRIMAKGKKFPPLIVIVDEAQVAFMCPAVGADKRPYGGTKASSRYYNAVRKLHNQGRAVDVLLWQGTQDPTDQNLPKLVREGAHTRVALVLGTESQARMAVGDKAVDGGAAPHLLRQDKDKGTVVVAGGAVDIPTGQSSVTVRTHFIDDTAATEITDRAKQRRGETATAVPTGEKAPDPLADIATVLGDAKRMRTEEVRQRLAEHNPRQYRDFTAQQLAAVLDAAGAPIGKSDGVKVVRRDAVRTALANRENPAEIDGE